MRILPSSLYAVLFATLPLPVLCAPDYEALREAELSILDRQFSAFRDASAALEEAAKAYCAAPDDAAPLIESVKSTWLAWAPLDSYQFGPMEHTGAALTVNFWPDKRGFVNSGVRQILSLPQTEQRSAAGITQVSAAGQGFPALAELLTNDDLPDCPAAEGLAANIAAHGAALHTAWFGPDGWADLVRAAGPENPVYLSDAEFTTAIFTALNFGAERVGDYRIKRPMGEERGGMPHRVDGYRLGLGNAILDAQIAGMGEMIADGFAPALTPEDAQVMAHAIEDARARINRIGMPLANAVTDPKARWRVDSALNGVGVIKMQLALVVGPALEVQSGFSPADGD